MNLPGYERLKAQSETAEGRKQIDDVQKLAAFAKRLGMPVHHLALRHCQHQPFLLPTTCFCARSGLSESNGLTN